MGDLGLSSAATDIGALSALQGTLSTISHTHNNIDAHHDISNRIHTYIKTNKDTNIMMNAITNYTWHM